MAAAPGPGSYSPKLPSATALRPGTAPYIGSAGFPSESGAFQHQHNQQQQEYVAGRSGGILDHPSRTPGTAVAVGGHLPPHLQQFGKSSGRSGPGGLFSSSGRSADTPGPGSYEPLTSSSTFCQYHLDRSRQSNHWSKASQTLGHVTARSTGTGMSPCFDCGGDGGGSSWGGALGARAAAGGGSSSSSFRMGAGCGISSSFVSKVERFSKPASALLKPGPGER